MVADVEVRGLKEAQAKMEQVIKDLHGSEFVNAMRDATMIVLRDARINAPVDTRKLQGSITPELRQQGNVVQGVVGSNVEYAGYVELGTRYMRARRYLQRALEDNTEKVFDLIGRFVSKIVEE